MLRDNTDLALESGSGLSPVRRQVFAVAAPGREELHQPDVVRLDHQLVEVGVRQLDDVLVAAAAAARLSAGKAVTSLDTVVSRRTSSRLRSATEALWYITS